MNILLKASKSILFLILLFTLTSCEFSFSTSNGEKVEQKDILDKLSTETEGLEYREIIISNGTNKINSSKVIYGDKLAFVFKQVKGFTEENDRVYPGLQILILGKNKDTVLYNGDLYANKLKGFKALDLDLFARITVATPLYSKNDYEVLVHIWDKKGTGTINSSLKLSLVSNDKINIKDSDFTFDEIYLYSDKRGVITDNKVIQNENIHFVIEGLSGLQINNGKVSFGTSIEARDTFGVKIIEELDLFKNTKGVDASKLKEGLSPYIFFNEKEEEGPVKVKCKIKVWDKKSNRSMTFYTNLSLVDEIE